MHLSWRQKIDHILWGNPAPETLVHLLIRICEVANPCLFLLPSSHASPFSITEHQNYFGIDESLGPVAVSVRREKVEDPKEKEGPQFNYRVVFRTSEVLGAVASALGWTLVTAWVVSYSVLLLLSMLIKHQLR